MEKWISHQGDSNFIRGSGGRPIKDVGHNHSRGDVLTDKIEIGNQLTAKESTSFPPGTQPGISIVIVSYNVRQYLEACLQSVFHSAKNFNGNVEIIVFDNDSRDGTLALLKPRYPEVVFLRSDRNLGFGSGCNRGAAMASQPLLLFLNPDTMLNEETLEVMWNFYSATDRIGIAGCKIVNSDGTLQLACKRSFPSPKEAVYKLMGLSNLFPKSKVFGKYNLTYLNENETNEVDAVSGSFLCISREFFGEINGFDEDFFMYGEDLDLCYRSKSCGRRNYYHPKTQVVHFKGQSSGTRPIRSFYNFYEAMVIFSKKHFELRTLPLTLFFIGIVLMAGVNFISNRFQKWQRWLLDLVLINGVLAGVTYAYQSYLGQNFIFNYRPEFYLLWHLWVSLCVLIAVAYTGDYGRKVQRAGPIAAALTGAFLLFYSTSYFFKEEAYSRIVFGITGLASIFLLLGWRVLVNQAGRLAQRLMGGQRRVAVIGFDSRARKLAEILQSDSVNDADFVGFISLENSVAEEMKPNLIGDISMVPSLVRKVDLNQVIIALEHAAYETALQILSENTTSLEVKILVGDPKPGALTLIDLNFRKSII